MKHHLEPRMQSAEPLDRTRTLCEFVAGLRFSDIPPSVVSRTEDLFLDWLASALAGRGERPTDIFERYASRMGPPSGPCTIVPSRKGTSPYFAALVNGASSHVVEQDDVHNGALFHPGTVVFPAALATAQDLGSSGEELIVASVAGYEAGIRIGEFLGRSHYRVFHTTGTAGTLAASVAVGKLMGFSAELFVQALGSAGTQAAGLWEFLRDAADSKQLHAGKAAADGLLAAYLARDGFTGARHILDGPQGMAAGMAPNAESARLVVGLGTRWATAETSFKVHASCRHTHPAADALLLLMTREGLGHDDIAAVTARVHQGALDVLGPVVDPRTVHQAKFSMGTMLGLIAVFRRAGLTEFEEHALTDPRVQAVAGKVRMVLDHEVDTAYPARWLGRVEVETRDGRHLEGAVDVPKGDPGNSLSRPEIEEKAMRLARFSHAATDLEMRAVIARIWDLRHESSLRGLFGLA